MDEYSDNGSDYDPMADGGEPDERAVRTQYFEKKRADATRRVLSNKESDCYTFLQGVIKTLNIPGLETPDDLIDHLYAAQVEVMGHLTGTALGRANDFGPQGNVWAQVTSSGFGGTGMADKLVLGYQFFYGSRFDPAAVLIHEAFHLFSGYLVLGYEATSLSDTALSNAFGVHSAAEVNDKILAHCPKMMEDE